MSRFWRIPVLIAFLILPAVSPALLAEATGSKYDTDLQKVFEIRAKISDIHSFFHRLFPIAVVEDDSFLVFDLDSSGERYTLAKKAPSPLPIPTGIRAAFPLECYGNRAACVVSGDVFESLEGYVTIFHEFMHCHQWATCEQGLKEKLTVAQEALSRQDYSWEINYPFPYTNRRFTKTYSLFLQALAEKDSGAIAKSRRRLQRILPQPDYEYLVWQEWKEGFARFIENRIRRRLALPENHYGQETPFHRITFYEGGAGYIEYLTGQHPELATNPEALFYKMFSRTPENPVSGDSAADFR